ncbi:hypothetical protein GJAV_G00115670 [Gymnothorax javanicus]|nr:hypothetical protein GJAV_G00115670 [Gymnothorax javanicus]
MSPNRTYLFRLRSQLKRWKRRTDRTESTKKQEASTMEQTKKITSLERHLERANIEMEELKKTHEQELDAKLKELRNELHNVAKERQEFLKAEVKRHRRNSEENLLACWSKDTELSKERKKTTELQRKVEELNAKLGEHAKNSAAASREKEDTAPSTLPRVSKITIEELKKQILHMGDRIASKDKENQMLKASTMEQTKKITSVERHLERATIEMEELKKTHEQ